ncbi:MAG: TlpA disulfide reductase family protein [Bacteroidales bacterium]|nr:TlpA disulfide reductase family protein [Bacteroidales bacterium]MDT8430265.1 TlpA disulfide reductase family protein [Bacteroidales bacterium]
MRKIYIGLVISSLLFSCGSDDNIIIRGSYPAGAGGYLQFEMLNIAEKQFIDSVKLNKKGDFKFGFNLDHPELILVKNEQDQYINLLAFPGDEIRLDIPQSSFRKGYVVAGSEESVKIRALVQEVEQTKTRLDSILDALNEMENLESPEAETLITTYREIFNDQKRANVRFIIENISSLSSVYALYQRVAPDVYLFNDVKDLQYYKIVSDSVRVKYPGSTLAKSLVNDVEQRITEYNNIITINKLTQNSTVETGLIDLVIEDVNGDPQSLRALDGKVILLNFWASWNNESRTASRRLIGLYNEYHDKGFEIYSVAMENDRNTWRGAVDFEEFPWINVSELSYPNSYAATVYNVQSIPANYLIDREGNIVAKNIESNVLATWLDNLL